MLKKLISLAFLTGLLICPSCADSAVICVNYNSPNNGPGTDWNHAFHTVQAGLSVAKSGNQVWVAKGTYVEFVGFSPNQNVGLYGGFTGTETALSQRNWTTNLTILDGGNSWTVVEAPQFGTQAARIDGFTIRNGNGQGGSGGGITCWQSSPTITNNIITGSSAGFGGGIDCEAGSSPTITNNTITGNSAETGGGIDCDSQGPTGCLPIVSNNTITGNSAQGGGGIECDCSAIVTGNIITGNTTWGGNVGAGINCEDGSPTITYNTVSGNVAQNGGGIYCACSATITNNIITGNSAQGTYGQGGGIWCYGNLANITNNLIVANIASRSGGGVYCAYSSPTLQNNTITGNSAPGGGGIYCYNHSSPAASNNIVTFNSSGIYTDSSGTPVIQHDDVYGNTGYNYFGMTDPTGINSNISSNPLLVDSAGGNYRLSTGSPCINAGINNVVAAPPFLKNISGFIIDLDGNPRIDGGTVDMGCYEWQCVPSLMPTIGQARSQPQGNAIQITGKPVTAVFGNAFYIEEPDRSGGLRILSSQSVNPGDLVTVDGPLALYNGELALEATSVSDFSGSAANIPNPLGMPNCSLGGGNYCCSAGSTPTGQQGITGATGINNIGLLVTTWGTVTYSGSGYFYLDDGSVLLDGSGNTGVKVYSTVLVAVGKYVSVTGISSCETLGTGLIRAVRTWESANVTIVK